MKGHAIGACLGKGFGFDGGKLEDAFFEKS